MWNGRERRIPHVIPHIWLDILCFTNPIHYKNSSEVKAEIVSDAQRLHRAGNGLFELFLLSAAVPGGGADTLPRVATKCGRAGGGQPSETEV